MLMMIAGRESEGREYFGSLWDDLMVTKRVTLEFILICDLSGETLHLFTWLIGALGSGGFPPLYFTSTNCHKIVDCLS